MAGALRVESTRASTMAGQLQTIDIGVFVNWLNAYTAGDVKRERLYRTRFRPEFRPAFDAWLRLDPLHNGSAPASPFVMPQYRLALAEKAAKLEADAGKAFADGQAANQRGDDYVLQSVLFAGVLFLGAISQQIHSARARVLALAVAALICIVGLYNVSPYPIE